MSDLNDCVLIVDDEFLIAHALGMQVEDMGLKVCGMAGSAEEAVRKALRHRPMLVLMDMRLQGTETASTRRWRSTRASAPP